MSHKIHLSSVFTGVFTGILLTAAVVAQEDNEKSSDVQKPEKITPTLQRPSLQSHQVTKIPQVTRIQKTAKPPKSILPKPFVQPGSVTLPADQGLPIERALSAGARENQRQAPNTQLGETQTSTDQSALKRQADDRGQQVNGTLYITGELEDIDPSIDSVGSALTYDQTFWDRYDHLKAAERLDQISALTLNTPARNMVRRSTIGRFNIKPESDKALIATLLRARLSVFEAVGDSISYRALLSQIPAQTLAQTLAQTPAQISGQTTADSHEFDLLSEKMNAALYAGNLAAACDLSAQARAEDANPFWVKVAVMCAAANGDRTAVDFQLGILEELEQVSPGFYALSDLILVEAEQSSGDGEGITGASLSVPLPLDSLSVSMARLARVSVETVDLETSSPLGLKAALALPGLSEEAQLLLLGDSIKKGGVPASDIVAFARVYQPDVAQLEGVYSRVLSDPLFEVDAILLSIIARTDKGIEERQRALNALWGRAVASEYTSSLAYVLHALTGDMPRRGVPSDAVRLRAALLANDRASAALLMSSLRSTAVSGQDQRIEAFIETIPLLLVSGHMDQPEFDAGLFKRWWDQLRTDADQVAAYAKASLLLSVAEGLGYDITAAHWELLEMGPVGLTAKAASPALWRALIKADRDRDKPQSLRLALTLLSSGSALSLSPAMVSSALNSLSGVGLVNDARLLGLDILMRAGL